MTRDVRNLKQSDEADANPSPHQSGEFPAGSRPSGSVPKRSPSSGAIAAVAPRRSPSSGAIAAVAPPSSPNPITAARLPSNAPPPPPSSQGGRPSPLAPHQSGFVPTTRRPKARGRAILMRKKFVNAKFGASAVELLESRASPELRAALSLAEQHDSWVDFGLFIEATELVDRLFGRGDLAIAWDVGRFAAENNIGVWRSIVMRFVSPNTVLNIASSVWSHHYDTGRLVAAPEEDHLGVRMSIVDFLWPHRTHCLSIGGWIERTLEFGKPKRVDVKELSCRAKGGLQCTFLLKWE